MPFEFGKGENYVETASAAGPNPYDDGSPPSISVPDVVSVEDVISVEITGGFVAAEESVSGNTVTYRVYEDNGAAADDPLGEIQSGETTDLSGETVTVTVQGV